MSRSRTHFQVGSDTEGLELEEVDKVLRRDGHEAAVWVVGCAWMATVLERQSTTTLLGRKVTRGEAMHAVHSC